MNLAEEVRSYLDGCISSLREFSKSLLGILIDLSIQCR